MKNAIQWEGSAKILAVSDHEWEGRPYSKCVLQIEEHIFRVSLNKPEVVSVLRDKVGATHHVILEIYPDQKLKPAVSLTI